MHDNNFGFAVLSILTVIFQIICALALVAGLIVVFSNQAPAESSVDLLARVPAAMRVAAGGALAFYGLAGLVFSGAVHVLIAIDAQTRANGETLAAALASLQRTLAANGPAASPVHVAKCPSCNAANDPNSRFCEACGTTLARS